jgi:hypothetical protein
MKIADFVWARSGAVLAIAVSAVWSAACGPARGIAPPAVEDAALSQGTACGPAVSRQGMVIRVEPAGAAHDTANLQCAFDLAVARPGSTVQLAKGTFVSDVIFVYGLVGDVQGEGEDETLVTNVPVIQVNHDFWTSTSPAPPSKDNVYPFLWTFIGGRFSMHDLKFRIQGAAPTSGWAIPNFGTVDALATAVTVTGTEAHAELSHVAFEGETDSQDPLIGYNLYNGVYFQSDTPDGARPATGSFYVHGCRFKTMASWAPIANVADAIVRVSDNDAEDLFLAVDILNVTRSTVMYGQNRVRGAVLAEIGEGGPLDSSLLILSANRFAAQQGVVVDGIFSGGTRCVIVGNWIDPPSAGITLGPATSNCLVANNHGATVVDNGTGNLVAGH